MTTIASLYTYREAERNPCDGLPADRLLPLVAEALAVDSPWGAPVFDLGGGEFALDDPEGDADASDDADTGGLDVDPFLVIAAAWSVELARDADLRSWFLTQIPPYLLATAELELEIDAHPFPIEVGSGPHTCAECGEVRVAEHAVIVDRAGQLEPDIGFTLAYCRGCLEAIVDRLR